MTDDCRDCELIDAQRIKEHDAGHPVPGAAGVLTARQFGLDQVEIANERLAEARAITGMTAPRLYEALENHRVQSLLRAGAWGHAALAIVALLSEVPKPDPRMSTHEEMLLGQSLGLGWTDFARSFTRWFTAQTIEAQAAFINEWTRQQSLKGTPS